jgi:hypothetical protein
VFWAEDTPNSPDARAKRDGKRFFLRSGLLPQNTISARVQSPSFFLF